MYPRVFWKQLVEDSWCRRNVIWLTGVRRTGKTFLCRSLDDVVYYDCELPRVRRMLDDPESFLEKHAGKRVVLDEIHRISDPSAILKIAADHFPTVRVIATGSSTLGASSKFKDTLTGRKARVWLTPMCLQDAQDFGNMNLDHRMLHGGLPPFFLADVFPERDVQDWVDSFWAKDVQELFRVEKRQGFLRFTELLLMNSGGIFEATAYAKKSEVSRTTISNYLSVLEETFVVTVVRPYSTHRPTEIVSAPKVYGFDTGFVASFRGWQTLRDEDRGLLWEHLVLNEIQARCQLRTLKYWRDKQQHEIDFIHEIRGRPPVVIECKWSASSFQPAALLSFRKKYPGGRNIVVSADVKDAYTHRVKEMPVDFVGLPDVIRILQDKQGLPTL